MNRIIKSLVDRLPFIDKLNEQVSTLSEEVRTLREQVKMEGAYPAGHYYSPIPSKEDILMDVNFRKPVSGELPGIKLNKESQHELLHEYAVFYKDLPFPEEQNPDYRYYYNNGWFSYSDAIFLYSFLRKQKPKRIVEVGSGFSSAVMLDTIDNFYSERPDVTFIEPYPDRLVSLFKEIDIEQVRLIDKKVQEVTPDVFLTLESGDFLFIDSSHVVKCGSDLQMLMFEIIPQLRPGVFVHFHDVFYPFTYPSNWLNEGRYWNENYFLRAFLSYNSEWSISFFNTYVHFMFGDLIKEKMPLCTRNPGGSLYLHREEANQCQKL